MRLPPLLSTCVLGLAVLAGCDNAPDPVPDAGTQVPTEDSGTDAGPPPPWDGSYTELAETGDWQDRGRFAPCSFNSENAPATGSCEDLTRYDLSQCNPDALANIEAHGVYQVDMRSETRLADGGIRVAGGSYGFKLAADGGGSMNNGPFRIRNIDGGTFMLSAERTSFNNITSLTALVGCNVPSPGIITGCFTRCRNGRFSQAGTFEAQRMTWAAGEAESSGGLRLISEAAVPLGDAVDIYVAKEHAYVVSVPRNGRLGGLSVFDVKDRATPVLKATISYPTDNYWNGVWAKGDALYVASASSGVVLFNISNPAAPEYVRSLPGGSGFGAHTVLVDGDRLYAMSGGDMLLVFDVSLPLAPVLRQSISPPPDSINAPHDAFAYEGRLYVSNSFGGYTVLDVTDLDNVRHLGQYVHGSYAHHSAVGTFAGRTIAFEGAEFAASHLRVLDVTRPERIVKIGEFRLRPVTSIHNMLLVGTKLYVAWYQEGVRVLDVSNPTQPRQVAHFNTFVDTHPDTTDSPFQGTYGIRIPGDGYVYTANSPRGLLIFNQL